MIHEIEEIDLRSVFPTEHRAFTPWLGRPENLARLARSLGIEIELDTIEAASETFRTDILAKNVADGTPVVIENQFGRSDHDHFGKAMTYLAAHAAKTVVWIAEAFADEHRAALRGSTTILRRTWPSMVLCPD
jgi:3-phosphoglycerate kinase